MHELRVAVTVGDLEAALDFYRDVGLPVIDEWEVDAGKGVALAAGRATLELLDSGHAAYVDEVEGARTPSGPVRLALAVDDLEATGARLGGSGWVGRPVDTPWGDRNMRVEAPEGMQLTLFAPRVVETGAVSGPARQRPS